MEYETWKDIITVSVSVIMPLVGHGIAYRILSKTTKANDERQQRDWQKRAEAESERFYLGKLELLHNEIIDLSYSFSDSFKRWAKEWQNGRDDTLVIENAREYVFKKCKLASAIVTIYFRKDFDKQLAELYLISVSVFSKMASITEESRHQTRLNLDSIVEDKNKFSDHIDKLLQGIQAKINQITSQDEI